MVKTQLSSRGPECRYKEAVKRNANNPVRKRILTLGEKALPERFTLMCTAGRTYILIPQGDMPVWPPTFKRVSVIGNSSLTVSA